MAPSDQAGWLVLLERAREMRDSRVASGRDTLAGATRREEQGKPVIFWDPIQLGVHRSIGSQLLPSYVRRRHDDLLQAVLDPAAAANRLVVLRGGSSTGKSRAAYQVVVDRLPTWQLIYPRTSTRLAEVLDRGIPARTVLWLNELRLYAESDHGSESLGRLAELLGLGGHVVAVTTLWPDYWRAYSADHQGGPGIPDSAAATRQLLAPLPDLTRCDATEVDPGMGGVIDVPERFTTEDLVVAHRLEDPALEDAIKAARAAGSDGEITQYLAGVPALLDHYCGSSADPYGQAVITAAMDAVHIGHAGLFSAEFLRDAVTGYLSDRQRATENKFWWNNALEYASRELKGAIRALEPIPPDHGTGIAGYALADYLQQYVRENRSFILIPASVWDALVSHTVENGKLEYYADRAGRCGLLRIAGLFAAKGAAAGNGRAMNLMGDLQQQAGRPDVALNWYLRAYSTGNERALYRVVELMVATSRFEEAQALLRDRIEDHGGLQEIEQLIELLESTGREEEAAGWKHRRLRTPEYQNRMRSAKRAVEIFGPWLDERKREGNWLDKFLAEHEISPDSIHGRFLISWGSRKMRQFGQDFAEDSRVIDGAASALREMARIAPGSQLSADNPETRDSARCLVELLIGAGRLGAAEAVLRGWTETSDSAWMIERMIEILKITGRAKEAIPLARRITMDQTNTSPWPSFRMLAALLRSADRTEEAMCVLQYGLEPGGRTGTCQVK